MKPYKKPPKKPLFDKKQGEIFIECIDDNTHKKIAKLIFVEGMTNLEVAEQTDYCVRQIERIKIDLMKIVLKRLIEKQIPKKPTPPDKKLTEQNDLTSAKAEIERLKKEKDEYAYLYEKHINTAFSHIKAEAYKEFAYELKQIPNVVVYKYEIDNLLKELVGDK